MVLPLLSMGDLCIYAESLLRIDSVIEYFADQQICRNISEKDGKRVSLKI